MSERLQSTGTVSNEEVIEDLTRDLRTLNTDGNYDEFVIDPEHSSADISPVHEQPRYPTGKSCFMYEIYLVRNIP